MLCNGEEVRGSGLLTSKATLLWASAIRPSPLVSSRELILMADIRGSNLPPPPHRSYPSIDGLAGLPSSRTPLHESISVRRVPNFLARIHFVVLRVRYIMFQAANSRSLTLLRGPFRTSKSRSRSLWQFSTVQRIDGGLAWSFVDGSSTLSELRVLRPFFIVPHRSLRCPASAGKVTWIWASIPPRVEMESVKTGESIRLFRKQEWASHSMDVWFNHSHHRDCLSTHPQKETTIGGSYVGSGYASTHRRFAHLQEQVFVSSTIPCHCTIIIVIAISRFWTNIIRYLSTI